MCLCVDYSDWWTWRCWRWIDTAWSPQTPHNSPTSSAKWSNNKRCATAAKRLGMGLVYGWFVLCPSCSASSTCPSCSRPAHLPVTRHSGEWAARNWQSFYTALTPRHKQTFKIKLLSFKKLAKFLQWHKLFSINGRSTVTGDLSYASGRIFC